MTPRGTQALGKDSNLQSERCITLPYFDHGDAQIFYTEHGSGPHTLLLLHGWSHDSNDWNWVIPHLQDRYRLVVADIRGHGHSNNPPTFALLEQMDDMVALMDHLGIEKCIPVGHSLGGAIAACMSVEHPDRVTAMVGVDPAYGHGEWFAAMSESGLEEWRKNPEEAHQLLIERMTAAGTTLATPKAQTIWNIRRISAIDPQLLWKPYEGLSHSSTGVYHRATATTYFEKRNVPVLSFHSLRDSAEWETTTLKDSYSKVVSWDGSGHDLHVERPNELATVIIQWIDGLPAA